MTIHRLLLREIALPLVLALVLVSQLLILMQMLQLNEVLFGSGFDPLGVVRIASYLAPHFGIIAVPLAFLFAVMLGIGRMGEDNELVALEALGRPPFWLYRVPILMSLVLGLAVGFLSFRGEPWGLRGVRLQINELIKRNLAADVQPGVFFETIPRFTMLVGDNDGSESRWHRVLLHDAGENEPATLMLARKGRMNSDGADAMLRLDLDDGEMHRADPSGDYVRARYDTAAVALGVQDFLRSRNRFMRPAAELNIEEMPAAAAEALHAGDERTARRLWTSFHQRIASLATCLVFGLVAVPLAASRRGARGRSFVATVAAFAGYYVLQTIASGLGETGGLPPVVAAWVPNAVGLVVAAALGWQLRHGLQAGARR